MSGLTHNVSAQADELLDHIYEYGTNSEGVIHRINQLCDAAVEQLRANFGALQHAIVGDTGASAILTAGRLRAELAASRAREARMREALRNLLALDVDHQRGADDEDVCAEVREARAALAEGAQG